MGQHLPDFSEPRWFACHTKPRAEKKFAQLLTREGFDHYLALIESVKIYGAQRKTFTKPLFPSYVFAQIPPDKKNRVYQQDLLVRAIMVENENVFLRQLSDVRTVCASGLEAVLHPLIKKGSRVKVTSGPLSGLEGFVDNPANPRGIVVSVDVLQQGLLITIPFESLKPLL